jgi:hypothetical protein
MQVNWDLVTPSHRLYSSPHSRKPRLASPK